MWVWRKIIRTSWIEHKTNEAILDKINERRIIINTIMKRKINGKETRGRPRKSFFEEILCLMVLPLVNNSRGHV